MQREMQREKGMIAKRKQQKKGVLQHVLFPGGFERRIMFKTTDVFRFYSIT